MTAQYSEAYYRKYWNEFLKKVPGNDYINLEQELAHEMEIFSELPDEALTILKSIKAREIAEKCQERLTERMATVKAIENGEANLGYTTQGQEIKARGELVRRFEFNCLQLADFKKKYLA